MKLHFCCLAVAITASASIDAAPFATSDRSSFARVHGLPHAESAFLLAAGASQQSLNLELTNQFATDSSAGEQLILDGETVATIYRWRYGLSDALEVGIELPWLHQSGGELDRAVEDWHQWFNFPNGDRADFARDQLRYDYSGPRTSRYFDNSNSHIGDVGLQLRYQLLQGLSAQLRLDAPTGSSTGFSGSGAWDGALGINASNREWLDTIGAEVHAGIGFLWFGDSEILPEINKGHAIYGNAALQLPVSWGWTAKVQLEFHTAMYDSALTPLGDTSVQVSFGGEHAIADGLSLELGMSEDISPNTAPDFSFLLGVNYRR